MRTAKTAEMKFTEMKFADGGMLRKAPEKKC